MIRDLFDPPENSTGGGGGVNNKVRTIGHFFSHFLNFLAQHQVACAEARITGDSHRPRGLF